MPVKKITRKVIAKAPSEGKVTKVEDVTKAEEVIGRVRKVCFFCQSKTNPSYTDIVVLRRFVSDRVKIVARAKNNLCSKHQRFATRQIKYARHLALLPFTPKV